MTSTQAMAAAMQAAQAGMDSAENHAESDAPGWSQRAYDAVLSNPYLPHLREFTMHTAGQWVYAAGLDEPTSPRAWGAVTQRLVREGRLVKVGHAPTPTSHGSEKPTYKISGPRDTSGFGQSRTHGESE